MTSAARSRFTGRTALVTGGGSGTRPCHRARVRRRGRERRRRRAHRGPAQGDRGADRGGGRHGARRDRRRLALRRPRGARRRHRRPVRLPGRGRQQRGRPARRAARSPNCPRTTGGRCSTSTSPACCSPCRPRWRRCARSRAAARSSTSPPTLGAHTSAPGTAAYGATKAAVSALTRAPPLEHIRDGVRINTVSPGSSDTTMSLRPGETRGRPRGAR